MEVVTTRGEVLEAEVGSEIKDDNVLVLGVCEGQTPGARHNGASATA